MFASRDPEWRKLRRIVMRRDQSRCQAACGCTDRLTVHHIIPRAEGGGDITENLITLCTRCHDEIEDTNIRTIERIRAYVPRWHEQAEWYNEKPKRVQHVARAPRKPRAIVKQPKQKTIHIRTNPLPEEPTPVRDTPRKARPVAAPMLAKILPTEIDKMPESYEVDAVWVNREIVLKLIKVDGDFDPAEINQTPEAWHLLSRWLFTGKEIPASEANTIGLPEECPIYEGHELYRAFLDNLYKEIEVRGYAVADVIEAGLAALEDAKENAFEVKWKEQ